MITLSKDARPQKTVYKYSISMLVAVNDERQEVRMCGRFAQYRSLQDYLRELDSERTIIGLFDETPIARYNIAQSTPVQLIHSQGKDPAVSAVKWGWRPHWAQGKQPPPINARLETVATSAFFRQIWAHRALVPADGWFEWVADQNEPKYKRPFYIHLRTHAPCFFAAIGQFPHPQQPQADQGFVIVTADAGGSMVDVHDRRPVTLAPSQARQWLDPNTPLHDAEQWLRQLSKPAEDFVWYPVGRSVRNVRSQGEELIAPLPLT